MHTAMCCDTETVPHVQRTREHIRACVNDATIRDTSLLIKASRTIEQQMVCAGFEVRASCSTLFQHCLEPLGFIVAHGVMRSPTSGFGNPAVYIIGLAAVHA